MSVSLLPAGTPDIPTVSLSGSGTLLITGSTVADSVTLQLVHDDPTKGFIGTVTGGSTKTTINIRRSFASVKRIYIDAGGGNDSVFIGSGQSMTRPVTILGGSGNDTINYRAVGPILASGGAGNDVVGADAIISVNSSRNRDVINTLFAAKNSTGVNTVLGGAGNDTLSGDTNDQLDGGAGSDTAVLVIAATDNSVPSDRRNALAELYYARLGAVSIEHTAGFSLLSSQG